ncbi:hypothetical protein ACCO45_010461 [Purpureocillium lilacinum]|uniref:Uncharacterized protein n=1 Tax=Purpureocillium lilacinum TaxID=33203 RepID=A0ACC4DFM4_PURLI
MPRRHNSFLAPTSFDRVQTRPVHSGQIGESQTRNGLVRRISETVHGWEPGINECPNEARLAGELCATESAREVAGRARVKSGPTVTLVDVESTDAGQARALHRRPCAAAAWLDCSAASFLLSGRPATLWVPRAAGETPFEVQGKPSSPMRVFSYVRPNADDDQPTASPFLSRTMCVFSRAARKRIRARQTEPGPAIGTSAALECQCR